MKVLRWIIQRRRHWISLLLLITLVFNTAWWITQALPLVVTVPSENALFFGIPHRAKQSPFFNRIVFQTNDDNQASYILWMNPANRARFDQWFGSNQSLRIEARRAYGDKWIVTALDTKYGGLDQHELTLWRLFIIAICAIAVWLSLLVLFRVGRDYLRYRRRYPIWTRSPG